MQFILAGTVRDEAGRVVSTPVESKVTAKASHLSSSPPSFRTIFRSEKTVPKTSFASSSVDRVDGEVEGSPLATVGVSEVGREGFPATEAGRGSQRRV